MHLEHFKSDEFRDWYDDMSPRLLTLLDVLRYVIGSPIEISANPRSLGREDGNSESAHNVEYWGEVLAADVFVRGVYGRVQAEEVAYQARRIGFTGIGVYADTTNNDGREQVMFHLDVRPTHEMGEPAQWGRVYDRDDSGKIKRDSKGRELSKYVSINQALMAVPE